MRPIASIFVILAIVLLGSGCQQPTDQIVYVPQKCHVKIIDEPTPQQCKSDNVLEWGKCAYKNYIDMKQAFELQQEESKVCE